MRKYETLFGSMVKTGGLRDASHALRFLAAWLVASVELGELISTGDLITVEQLSRAQLYRERASLSACLSERWEIHGLLQLVWDNRRLVASVAGGLSDRDSVMMAISELRVRVLV